MANIARIHIPNGADVEGFFWGRVSLWDEVDGHVNGLMITHARAVEILQAVEMRCAIKSWLVHPVVVLPIVVGCGFLGLALAEEAIFLVAIAGIFLYFGSLLTVAVLLGMATDGTLRRISRGYADVAAEARALRAGLDPALRQQAVFVHGAAPEAVV